MAEKQQKAKYWVAVCYTESMIDDWKEQIGDILQLPYAYCVHDKDLDKEGEIRKPHAHIMIAFPNTTTYNHALSVFKLLSKQGSIWTKKGEEKAITCCNTCQVIIGIRNQYDYLIHDTDDAKKAGKYLYSKEERITGNNFDIGLYEQISLEEKRRMLKELCDVIRKNEDFTNFIDFYGYVVDNLDIAYFDVLATYSGLLERMTKGNYQKLMKRKSEAKEAERELNKKMRKSDKTNG